MAEDLRNADSNPDLSASRKELKAEALRQMESCLYTSTMCFMWLRRVRVQQKVVVLLPVVLTAVAGFSYAKDVLPAWVMALIGFAASLIPAIAKAIEIETQVDELKRDASEYKSLQDRFRILARITTNGPFDGAENRLNELMDRLDLVRATAITPPERYFKRAQKKIKSGDYDFSVDIHA